METSVLLSSHNPQKYKTHLCNHERAYSLWWYFLTCFFFFLIHILDQLSGQGVCCRIQRSSAGWIYHDNLLGKPGPEQIQPEQHPSGGVLFLADSALYTPHPSYQLMSAPSLQEGHSKSSGKASGKAALFGTALTQPQQRQQKQKEVKPTFKLVLDLPQQTNQRQRNQNQNQNQKKGGKGNNRGPNQNQKAGNQASKVNNTNNTKPVREAPKSQAELDAEMDSYFASAKA
jgi:hypothetical protein